MQVIEFQQISLLEYLNNIEEVKSESGETNADENAIYDPIEDFAMHGSGFEGGKKRISDFFRKNSNKKERINFLRKEYGTGGFSGPTRKVNTVYEGLTIGCQKDISIGYTNSKMEDVSIDITWSQLEKTIQSLILKRRYK